MSAKCVRSWSAYEACTFVVGFGWRKATKNIGGADLGCQATWQYRLHSVGRQCIEKRSRLPKKKCLAREKAARLAWLLSHVGRSRCAAREGGGEWERPSASDARWVARGVRVRDAFADAVAAPGRGSCCEGLAGCKCSFPTVQTA